MATESRHETPDQRVERGRSARAVAPRSAHGDWSPAQDRPDPVELLEQQNEDRLPWLVPVRRGRMSTSPFAFYRGAARIMASDLASTPVSGLTVQACGDAHLSNFGMYASPERQLVFDVNDLDETLPGPWEWDLKRLATSFVIVGEHRGFDRDTSRAMTAASVHGYREAMSRFAEAGNLDIWYALLSVELLGGLASSKKEKKTARKAVKKARSRDSLQALRKLAESDGDTYRIRSEPPVLLPLRELQGEQMQDRLQDAVTKSFRSYLASLPSDRRHLLSTYRFVDIALKVVGVGSVGTRCLVVLLEGRDRSDPLFLQVKEASASVLEEHLTRSPYQSHGRRVVEGQHLMQAASDVFLGWSESIAGRSYYWRQLRDWKASADVERLGADGLTRYGTLCGWTLAHAHARSGDAIAISAYLGKGSGFDDALVSFAETYAEQNRSDYQAFVSQIEDGSLEADTEG
jgi:uncharacterized protein (DUF2252 family)